uniref:FAD-dependent oxidoreductase n=1 Tax=uncultured Acinetobacter sp. TaxID=165433 RepID=UPI002593E04C
HIIVPKLYDGDKAFIMQNDDQRIVFAIPYLQQYTLIGTTDQEFQGDPNHVEITQHEIDYLLDVSNDHFKVQLTQDDIVASYSGVRPLCDDESDNPSAVTRDYTLSLTQVDGAALLLSVFGGKLTTYRKLAESAMTLLKPYFEHMRGVWTAAAKLPGAEHLVSLDILKLNILEQIQNLDDNTAERWTHAYGSRVWDFLKNIHNVDELGQHFGCGLYAQEVDYLVEHEWARTSQDILKRRTKLYLKFEEESVQVLDKYLISLRERRLKKEVA